MTDEYHKKIRNRTLLTTGFLLFSAAVILFNIVLAGFNLVERQVGLVIINLTAAGFLGWTSVNLYRGHKELVAAIRRNAEADEALRAVMGLQSRDDRREL